MEVKLYKKTGKYVDNKTQKEKQFVNFYVKCNDTLIPIEPCYFPNAKCDNRDPQFANRKGALEAFADVLPDKEEQNTKTA